MVIGGIGGKEQTNWRKRKNGVVGRTNKTGGEDRGTQQVSGDVRKT